MRLPGPIGRYTDAQHYFRKFLRKLIAFPIHLRYYIVYALSTLLYTGTTEGFGASHGLFNSWYTT